MQTRLRSIQKPKSLPTSGHHLPPKELPSPNGARSPNSSMSPAKLLSARCLHPSPDISPFHRSKQKQQRSIATHQVRSGTKTPNLDLLIPNHGCLVLRKNLLGHAWGICTCSLNPILQDESSAQSTPIPWDLLTLLTSMRGPSTPQKAATPPNNTRLVYTLLVAWRSNPASSLPQTLTVTKPDTRVAGINWCN